MGNVLILGLTNKLSKTFVEAPYQLRFQNVVVVVRGCWGWGSGNTSLIFIPTAKHSYSFFKLLETKQSKTMHNKIIILCDM